MKTQQEKGEESAMIAGYSFLLLLLTLFIMGFIGFINGS